MALGGKESTPPQRAQCVPGRAAKHGGERRAAVEFFEAAQPCREPSLAASTQHSSLLSCFLRSGSVQTTLARRLCLAPYKGSQKFVYEAMRLEEARKAQLRIARKRKKLHDIVGGHSAKRLRVSSAGLATQCQAGKGAVRGGRAEMRPEAARLRGFASQFTRKNQWVPGALLGGRLQTGAW